MSRVIPVSVLGVFVLLEACHAHLCLISPTQRGSLAGINKQGMICPPPPKKAITKQLHVRRDHMFMLHSAL